MRDAVPLGRLGDPAGFAQPVVVIASAESSFTTASEFFVDGGLTRVSYTAQRG